MFKMKLLNLFPNISGGDTPNDIVLRKYPYCVREYNKAIRQQPYCLSSRAYCVRKSNKAIRSLPYCVSPSPYCV